MRDCNEKAQYVCVTTTIGLNMDTFLYDACQNRSAAKAQMCLHASARKDETARLAVAWS